jgi:hypothetical protein
MYRIISSRAPHPVSDIRTLRATLNGKSKFLRRLAAPASASLCSEVNQPFFGHATFFSTSRMMGSLRESRQLTQPTLVRHVIGTLTRTQAPIPTAIRVVDGFVAMR